MKFDEIKAAVMNLDAGEQRRVVLELLPAIWPKIVEDDSVHQVYQEVDRCRKCQEISARAPGPHLIGAVVDLGLTGISVGRRPKE